MGDSSVGLNIECPETRNPHLGPQKRHDDLNDQDGLYAKLIQSE